MLNKWDSGVKKSSGNAFDWYGPSQVVDKWGRMKTVRQMHLDGNRVNSESNIAVADRTDREAMKKARI